MYDNNKRIIYCPYDDDAVRSTHETNVIRKIHYSKLKLAQRLGGNNPDIVKDLYNKIYPIRNNHLFDFGFTSKHRDIARLIIIKNLIQKK